MTLVLVSEMFKKWNNNKYKVIKRVIPRYLQGTFLVFGGQNFDLLHWKSSFGSINCVNWMSFNIPTFIETNWNFSVQ